MSYPNAERSFPPPFPMNSVAIFRTLWETCHAMWETDISHWNFAGMHCPGLKQGSRYLFPRMSSDALLQEGTLRLPHFSKVIRTDSTDHSFSQTFLRNFGLERSPTEFQHRGARHIGLQQYQGSPQIQCISQDLPVLWCDFPPELCRISFLWWKSVLLSLYSHFPFSILPLSAPL